MKKLFALSFVSLFVLGSCNKKSSCGYTKSSIVAPASEQSALLDSLNAHGLKATLSSEGFYYSIAALGTGAGAKGLCSTVAVYYRGGFFNGKGFDSTRTVDPTMFELGQVIPGWQKGIPLVGKNGDITLYIPPSLAYGSSDFPSQDNPVIPANSYLVFHVVVANIQ